MAVGNTVEQRETGDRRNGWGKFLSGLRSRPSGIWSGCSGSGAGGGTYPFSPQFSPPWSNLSSVICHRFSHRLSSRYVMTRSPPYPWQTRAARGAAPTPRQALPYTRYSILDTLSIPPSAFDAVIFSGGGWRPQVAGGRNHPFSPPPSPQRSPPFKTPSSIQSSVIDSAINTTACYVVTRSRPYPKACTPPILDTQYSILSDHLTQPPTAYRYHLPRPSPVFIRPSGPLSLRASSQP